MMKELVNELIAELVNCVRRDEKFEMPKKHLKEITSKMEPGDYAFPFLHVVNWIKRNYLNRLEEGEKKDFFQIDGSYQHRCWKDIFRYAPVMRELFEREENILLWNPLLTTEEIEEIIQYVGENYNPKMRVYIGPKK